MNGLQTNQGQNRGVEARRSAFTLIEILVVIAIIALLAGLIVGLAPAASEKKVRTRAQALLSEIETAIDSYKSEVGFLPPDNPNNTARPPLYYSLKGTVRNAGGTAFWLDGQVEADAVNLAALNVQGFVNSVEGGVPKDFYPNLSDSHVKEENGIRYLAFPYAGPDGELNPVRYDASSPNRNNPDSYDLWVEVVVRGNTVTIGNWE